MTGHHKSPATAGEDKDQKAKTGSKQAVEKEHQLFGEILHEYRQRRARAGTSVQRMVRG
jgi:hypothetical protein